MGFLGFGNYSKPGKGVKKDEQEKKRIFQFFELFGRKFSRVVQLSLLFSLLAAPGVVLALALMWAGANILTSDLQFQIVSVFAMLIAGALAGPAMAGTMKIARCFSEEKPVFLLSDFWDAYKENFKQSLIIGFLNSIIVWIIVQALYFYLPMAYASSAVYWVLIGLVLMVSIILICANFYVYLLIVSVNLNLFGIIKNSIFLAFLGLKSNFFTFIFTVALAAAALWWFPVSLLAMIPFGFGFIALIIAFNSFQYIYRYCIRPYYIQNNLPDPYAPEEEEEESIFADAT